MSTGDWIEEDYLHAECECGRGEYDAGKYSSCYNCFLDRRADYVECIYCDRWHSPEFDTCFECRPQGRDEAAHELKLVILARDSFACRYCGIGEGEMQVDPRLVRPKCPPDCIAQHNHRRPCRPKCGKRHTCRGGDAPGLCQPGCYAEHAHLVKDDDGVRPARLHIDHIMPCALGADLGATSDPWNLQVLCGVCNIAKGSEWWRGSRHYLARRQMVAAYATYLHDYLSESERRDLADELSILGMDRAEARLLSLRYFVAQVKACRPRPSAPSPEPQVEDVPPEYAYLDTGRLRLLDGAA